jgi:dTDP-4-dehydrorhamnose 3,5-epimerase
VVLRRRRCHYAFSHLANTSKTGAATTSPEGRLQPAAPEVDLALVVEVLAAPDAISRLKSEEIRRLQTRPILQDIPANAGTSPVLPTTRIPTRINGLVLLEPAVHADSRGFFVETYSRESWEELGVAAQFVQDNHSRSTSGTIRAFHFQADPGQPKLVRVARGQAWDVVVDIRRSSPTFGEWESFDLDDERNLQLYVPIGFAHGFCAVSDVVDFVYKVGSYYDPATERGIAWDDPDLGIPWPVDSPIVSERDGRNPTLAQISDELPAW